MDNTCEFEVKRFAKILLLDTSIASYNMGDEIINDSISKNWPELYQKNYIFRMASHTPPFSWWQQFLHKKTHFVKECDYKFLCGTNALYTNMVRPIPLWNIHLGNASIYRDTILLGVGAGINSKCINAYTRCLYNRILSKQYIHSVRDEYTKDFLERIGFKAYNTGCPTLWGLTPECCKKIPIKKAESVVFTLTGYDADELADKKMIEILSDNYRTLYFWPQTLTDLAYLYKLGDFNVKIVPPNLYSYDRVLDTNIDYVGNRLHGGIRALQHKKRALIISIDYRADNMHENYSLPIIKRENITDQLENWIQYPEEIQISGLNWDLINRWKQQFCL